MKKNLVIMLVLTAALLTAGCTTPPGDKDWPPNCPSSCSYRFIWESNSSYNVPISSLNLSSESQANLLLSKPTIKFTINQSTREGEASFVIKKDSLYMDFYAHHSLEEDEVVRNVSYPFRMELEINSTDPAVSGLSLMGSNNVIEGAFVVHKETDLDTLEVNTTDPAINANMSWEGDSNDASYFLAGSQVLRFRIACVTC